MNTFTCAFCGTKFQAKNSTAKYCSRAHRVAAAKRRQRGQTDTLLPQVPEPDDEKGQVAPAVLAELTKYERHETWKGQAALELARRIDSRTEPGTALAALTKQLYTAMDEALAGVTVADDPLDELKAWRERRRAG